MTTTRVRRREDVEGPGARHGRAAPGRARRGRPSRCGPSTRDLGMVSSAVYRDVANRDELLTLLLVDAYGDQSDAVDAAMAAVADQLVVRRACSRRRTPSGTGRCVEPSRYALLYGSPVPGYAAPAAVTNEPGTRVIGALLGLVAEGRRSRATCADAAGPGTTHAEPLASDLRGSRVPRSGSTRTRQCCPGRRWCGPPSWVGRAWRCSGSTVRTPSGTRARPTTSRSGWRSTCSVEASTRPESRRQRGADQRPSATRATWARTTASTRSAGNGSR